MKLPINKLKIKCPDCGKSYQYTYMDLEITATQDDTEASLKCKKCKSYQVGSDKEIQTLMEDYPEYEPDPDFEFGSYNEELTQNFGGRLNKNLKEKKL